MNKEYVSTPPKGGLKPKNTAQFQIFCCYDYLQLYGCEMSIYFIKHEAPAEFMHFHALQAEGLRYTDLKGIFKLFGIECPGLGELIKLYDEAVKSKQ